jgi:surfeit locus 1 family protein
MIRFRPLLGPTLFLIPALALMTGLGVWQLQRLDEKLALLASIAAGLNAPPVPLAQVLAGRAPVEWRRVQVHGRFDHGKEAYFFGRDLKGAVGVHVITPLAQDNGETVLIDRGFVPEDRRDPTTRAEGQTGGDAAVSGILRLSQQGGAFTPPPDLTKKLFFVRDVPAIAAAVGVAVPPILIEADATPNPGGWPLGGQTNIDIPNNHLAYALTWFGLALTLAVIYLLYHRSAGRLTLGRT